MTEPLKQTPTYSLDEIEQMLSAVTPGPWTYSAHQPNPTTGDWLNFEDEHGVYPPLSEAGPVCETSGDANARFIAASPTIVRALLDGYRALSASRDALAEQLDDERRCHAIAVERLEAKSRELDAMAELGLEYRERIAKVTTDRDALAARVAELEREVAGAHHGARIEQFGEGCSLCQCEVCIAYRGRLRAADPASR